MQAVRKLLGRWSFWASLLFLVILALSLGSCTKNQYVGVETGAIRPAAELMVPPQELPRRDVKNPDMKDAARALGEDRRIGGEAIRKLKDLQKFEKSRIAGRDQLKITK